MAFASTSQVLAATRQWLRPVIHILIRSGVTWREFAELSKTTYVEVATSKFGKRGRPTNVSRTAVLTGLARREVRRQREKIDAEPAAPRGHITKGALVLEAWHREPGFVDEHGKPLLLPRKGPGISFETLVRRSGGSDVRPTTLLKEMISSGAVREHPDGRLEALSRLYIPHEVDAEMIRLWGSGLADLAMTYAHNLTRTAKTPPRFERQAVNDHVSSEALPEFREFLEREGQAFLERVDAWLAEHEASEVAKGKEDGEAIRLGVGMYHIQD
ncbi:MAG TPA: DUF6502 family protein [Steroidobacteraceae bacterium]